MGRALMGTGIAKGQNRRAHGGGDGRGVAAPRRYLRRRCHRRPHQTSSAGRDLKMKEIQEAASLGAGAGRTKTRTSSSAASIDESLGENVKVDGHRHWLRHARGGAERQRAGAARLGRAADVRLLAAAASDVREQLRQRAQPARRGQHPATIRFPANGRSAVRCPGTQSHGAHGGERARTRAAARRVSRASPGLPIRDIAPPVSFPTLENDWGRPGVPTQTAVSLASPPL